MASAVGKKLTNKNNGFIVYESDLVVTCAVVVVVVVVVTFEELPWPCTTA